MKYSCFYLILFLLSCPLRGENYMEGEFLLPLEKEPQYRQILHLEDQDLSAHLEIEPGAEALESLCLALDWKDAFAWGPLSSRGLYSMALEGASWSAFHDSTGLYLDRQSRNWINQGALIRQGNWEFWFQKKPDRESMGVQWDPEKFTLLFQESDNREKSDPLETPWTGFHLSSPITIYHLMFREKPDLWGFSLAASSSFAPALYPGSSLVLHSEHSFFSLTLEQLFQISTPYYRDQKGDLLETPLLQEFRAEGDLPGQLNWKGSALWSMDKNENYTGDWSLQLIQGVPEKGEWALKGYGYWGEEEDPLLRKSSLGYQWEKSACYGEGEASLNSDPKGEFGVMLGSSSGEWEASVKGSWLPESLVEKISLIKKWRQWEGQVQYQPMDEVFLFTLRRSW